MLLDKMKFSLIQKHQFQFLLVRDGKCDFWPKRRIIAFSEGCLFILYVIQRDYGHQYLHIIIIWYQLCPFIQNDKDYSWQSFSLWHLRSNRHWYCIIDLFFLHQVKRTSLVDSRTSVTDVKFAPKHLGLRLVR